MPNLIIFQVTLIILRLQSAGTKPGTQTSITWELYISKSRRCIFFFGLGMNGLSGELFVTADKNHTTAVAISAMVKNGGGDEVVIN